jgi:adenylate cyclase
LQGNAFWAAIYRILAACYAHLGRLDDARAAVQRLPQTDPGLTVAKATELYGGCDNADIANTLAGLRPAGLPE